jgi:hypothetical protein
MCVWFTREDIGRSLYEDDMHALVFLSTSVNFNV